MLSSAHSDRSSVSRFLSDASTLGGPSSPLSGLRARERCLREREIAEDEAEAEEAEAASCEGSSRNWLFSSQSHSSALFLLLFFFVFLLSLLFLFFPSSLSSS